MSSNSMLLLMIMIIGAFAKPIENLTDESINKIDHGIQREEKDLSEDKESLESNANRVTTPKAEETTPKPGPLSWFLTPFSQNFQFSPQSFLQDRIGLLKETLNSLGVQIRQVPSGKQLGNANTLLHVGNDPGFYTNRLDSAGFLGGNGWFANKGGIVGGPGALLSTGSILTDYPTPYRKR